MHWSAGTHYIDDPIPIEPDEKYYGEHSKSILKPTGDFPIFEFDATQRRTDHIVIQNLMIDCINRNLDRFVAEILGECCNPDNRFAKLIFKDIVIANADTAFDITWGSNIVFDNVYAINCNRVADIKSFSTAITFDKCTFQGMLDKGIHVQSGEGIRINNTDFLACNNSIVVDWVWIMNMNGIQVENGFGNSLFLKGGRGINVRDSYLESIQPSTFNAILRSETIHGLSHVKFSDVCFEHGPYYNMAIDNAVNGINENIVFDHCLFRYGGCKLDYTPYEDGQGNTALVGPNTQNVFFKNNCVWRKCVNSPHQHVELNNPQNIVIDPTCVMYE